MFGIGASRNTSSALIESARPMFMGMPMEPGCGFTPQITGMTEAAKRLVRDEQIRVKRITTIVDTYPDEYVNDTGPVDSTFSALAWVPKSCVYDGQKLPNGREHIFCVATYTYRGTAPEWTGAVFKSVVQNMMSVHDFGFYFLCLMDQTGNCPNTYMWTKEEMDQVVIDFFRDPHETQRRIEQFCLDQ